MQSIYHGADSFHSPNQNLKAAKGIYVSRGNPIGTIFLIFFHVM